MSITRIKNNQITDATITNVKIASGTLTGDKMNANLTFNSNLTLNGNLVVTGNVTAVQSTTTQITDPLLTLGLGNAGTSYDLGLVLIRGSGGNRFIGWKENESAFVFINTTEDGLTTGNIATTAYSNVIFGNMTTIGTTTIGGITLSANTISAAGALTIRSDAGAITLSNALTITSSTIITGTLSTGGTATVNSLISNGAIQGTTGSFYNNLTAQGLTVNTSAVITNSLQALGGLQATPIGNAAASTGQFTTISATGNVTGAAITSNGSMTVGTTLGVTGNINGSSLTLTGSETVVGSISAQGGLQATPIGNVAPSTALFTTVGASGNITASGLTVNNSVVIGTDANVIGTLRAGNLNSSGYLGVFGNASAGNISTPGEIIGGRLENTPIGVYTPSTAKFTTVGASGLATVDSLTVNTTATVGTTLVVGSTATVNSLISNGSIQGTTLNGSGNATVNGLTVNTSAVVGTTLQAVAGIQNTAIGNITPASGAFTTLDTTGAITGASSLVTTGAATHSALTVNGAATIGSTLTTTGTATVNALVANTTFTATTGTILGNLLVEGNLRVMGNLSYFNIDTYVVEDPIIELHTGPNGAPLSADDGSDVGVRAHYYTSTDRSAFFGYKNSSGYFEYYSNVTSETGNVITGTYGTIKGAAIITTGTANSSIGGNLSVSGNLSVTNQIQSNTFTTNTLTINGNLSAGNISTTKITAVDGVFTNNVTVAGTLTATSNVVANSSGIFFGNSTTGLNAIYAGLPTYTLLPNVVAQFTTNVNNYSQLNVQNLSNGSAASTDFVATADNGTDSSYYVDLGINSSNFDNPTYSGYGPNDSYLLADGGNLILNVESGSKELKFLVGGYLSSNKVAGVDTTRFAVNLTTASTNSTNGAIVTLGGLGVAGAINGGSTLNVTGTATVNSLVSNGAVSGTTAQFTTVNGSANATVNALTVNNSATIGTTLGVAGNINGTSATLTGSATIGTTLGVTGNINGTSLTLTGSETVVGSLSAAGGLQATPIGNAAPSTALFTTVGASSNATVAALTVNASAVVGTTLQAVAGIQDTPIGNVTASSGAFTTLTASGLTTLTNSTDSTGPTTGALVVTGGLGVGKTLNVTTAANIGNVTISNLTISSNITNSGITINPNGTGQTTINSGLNNSRTVINGTTNANTFVVNGTQVGITTNTFVTGATFQVNATDSMLIPAGATGTRPGSPTAGMLRFNTSDGTIEWWDGAAWERPTGDFTVVVANSQTGNGSATIFTLPVSNASTAGTIVSINGVVQEPITAYAISGNTVTFTEAPASTDNIDFRVFTTTVQVTSVLDAAGTTGLLLDTPTVGNKIILFKTNGTESLSIQANGTLITGNILPQANATSNIGSLAMQYNTVFAKATSAQYADLAEYYASDDVYPPGTVLDFGGVAEVTLSTSNASTRVAGVVSTNPAYLMNSAYDGGGKVVAIALTGRVPCLVKGPVRKGDMMVSAGQGYARAETNPKIGSVIGKALENFNDAEGVIEVVVGRL